MNLSYAVPGSGRAFQLPMPRCFAVVASCPHHIATVPHVRNAGSPRVQSLVGGGSAGPGIALSIRRAAEGFAPKDFAPCR